MRFRSSRLLGYTIQAITIYLGINIIYKGHRLVGALVALGSLFANVALKSAKVKKDSLKSTFKLSLLSLGIVIWMMSGKRSHVLQDRGDDTLHSRTHNIITPSRAKHSVKATKTNVKIHQPSRSHIDTDKPAITSTETADEKTEDINDKNGPEKSRSNKKKKEKRKYVIRKETDSDRESSSDKLGMFIKYLY
jgi:hypothetical protein